MGKEAEANGGGDADVSAVGALVWVRRPNGSWWPGRVVSRLDVPDGCPAPPRSPATPIVLLGRRDGPAFVDWCNLERSKRVKPFRCGETDLDDCIRRAEEQAARRRRSAGAARYARKEDAVLQALDIERARVRLRSRATQEAPSSSSCPPPPRKRKTPNDSEDDAPTTRRMRDLTDIGSPPKPNAAAFSDLNRRLPTASQMKRSRQAHHDAAAAAKRSKRPPTADQDNQPCGVLRKKDRSRPLSELCNGDVFKPSNGHRAGHHSVRVGSSLDTSLDKFKTEQAKGGNGTSCITRSLDDDDGVFTCDAPLAARSILKGDHLHAHQPCGSTKSPPTWECTKRASNCSKDGISSQCDGRNSKKKTMSSVGHAGSNRTKNVLEREHRKGTAAKHKAAPSNEVVLLERRTEKSAADKAAEPDEDDKSLVVMLPNPNGLDRVHAVLQQRSEIKCELEEPSGTISIHSNGETGSAPLAAVLESPCQVLPPQHRDPRCHAVKPTKTLQLNPSLYDVELSAQGCGSSSSSKGRHVPLVSLMSRSSRRPVVGYPVSVEALDAVRCHPPAPSVDDDHPPSTSSGANGPAKKEEEEAAALWPPPPSSHKARARSSRRKAASEDEPWRPHTKEPPSSHKARARRKAASEDESWRPHSKKPVALAASSSPRKMRRLSSLGATSQRGEEERRRRRPAAAGELAVACVPVRVVFSRIKEALLRLK